ncbi:type VI secretion system protein TssA [Sphingomonas radiodurans]|uniref:type VI secretion system protein TssA n=1 Tax=Sphingomonas radiodurans TaxID=2890321 RepID=UPI001E2E1BD6|nr:type VI secretion system ImpA family N-terminal domain-containing protein [Sphingomonas radiodurans]WBH16703.1 type VI secretion system ImpA family N-terminal domain-containing protein [Sphingomonas radiodurans]
MRSLGGGVLIEEEDREAVLAPIDGSVGVDGREDEGAAADLLREIRSQRKSLVKMEQSLSMGDEPAIPEGGWDWDDIGENARDYLTRFGKDLEPMAVLIEAAVRQDGPEDLAAAMALLADVIETYWDQGLYPAEDEDGVETRFQPLSGLSGGGNDREGALILPLRRLALVKVGGDALRHLDKVRADSAMTAAQTATDSKAAKIEEAETTYKEIEQIVRRTSRAALEKAEAAIAAAHADWRRAINYITERTKPAMPAASRLTDELAAIRAWLQGLIALLPAAAQAVDETSVEPAGGGGEMVAAGGATAAAGGFVGGRITRREDALKAVSLAADYFTAFEPLSPLGMTLREVDRRARMSLHDYMAELIPDESARNDFYWRSGIKPPEAPAASWE